MLSAVRRVACAPLHAHGATSGVATTGQGVGAGVRIVVGSSASGMATLTGADGRRKWAFFGPPGVGKGTFASRVSPAVGIPTISTGDIVRAEIKADSELGKQFKVIALAHRMHVLFCCVCTSAQLKPCLYFPFLAYNSIIVTLVPWYRTSW